MSDKLQIVQAAALDSEVLELQVRELQSELAANVGAVSESSALSSREIEELREEVKAKEDLIEELQSGVDATQEVAAEQAHEAIELREQLQFAQAGAKETKEKLREVLAELETLQSEVEALKAEREKDSQIKEEQFREIDAKDSEIAGFKLKVHELQEKLAETPVAVVADEAIVAFKLRIHELEEELATSQAAISDQQMTEFKLRIHELEEELASSQAAVSDAQITDFKLRIHELEEELATSQSTASDKQITDLKLRIHELEEELATSHAAVSDKQITDYKLRIHELEEELATSEAAVSDKQVTDLKLRIHELEEELATSAAAASDKQITDLKLRIHELEEELATSQAAVSDAQVTAYKLRIHELEEELAMSEAAISDAQVTNFKLRIHELEEELASSQAAISDVEVTGYKLRIHELEEELASSQATISDIEVTAFKLKIHELEEELESAKATIDDAESKYHEALSQMSALQEELEAFKDGRPTGSLREAELQMALEAMKESRLHDSEAKDFEIAALKKSINDLEANLENARLAAADAFELQKSIDTLTKEALDKDATHETAVAKIALEKESIEGELTTLHDTHSEEFETLRGVHARTLDEIVTKSGSGHTEPIKELQEKHNALSKEKEDLETLVQKAQESEVEALRDAERKADQLKALAEKLAAHEKSPGQAETLEAEHAALKRDTETLKTRLYETQQKYELVLQDVQDKAARLEELSSMLATHENLAKDSQALLDEHTALKVDWDALKVQLAESEENHANALHNSGSNIGQIEQLSGAQSDRNAPVEGDLALQNEHAALKQEWESLKAQLSDSQKKHTEVSCALRDSHIKEVADLKERYNGPLSQLESRYATLERERDEAEYHVIAIRNKHSDELMTLQDSHDQETEALERKINALTAQLVAAQESASRSVSNVTAGAQETDATFVDESPKSTNTELQERHDTMTREWAVLKAQITETQEAHTNEVNTLHADYFAKLATLKDELVMAHRQREDVRASHERAIAELTTEHKHRLSASPHRELTHSREDSANESDHSTERDATIVPLSEGSMAEEQRADTETQLRDEIAKALEAAERDHAELIQDRDDTITALQDEINNTFEAAETKFSIMLHERDSTIATLSTEIESLKHDLQTSRNAHAAGGSEDDFLDRETFIREMEELKARSLELETMLEVARRELLDERERMGSLRRKLVGGVLIRGDGEMDDPFAASVNASPGGFDDRGDAVSETSLASDGLGNGGSGSGGVGGVDMNTGGKKGTLEGTVSISFVPFCAQIFFFFLLTCLFLFSLQVYASRPNSSSSLTKNF